MKEILKSLVSKKGLIIEGSVIAASFIGVIIKRKLDDRKFFRDTQDKLKEDLINDNNED